MMSQEKRGGLETVLTRRREGGKAITSFHLRVFASSRLRVSLKRSRVGYRV